jgi:hypothetical protein
LGKISETPSQQNRWLWCHVPVFLAMEKAWEEGFQSKLAPGKKQETLPEKN